MDETRSLNPIKKRIRIVSARRWTKEDKNLLLELIQDDPLKFEKPTAQLYYNQIIRNHSRFQEYGWKAMRDKLRNLRASYNKALELQNNIENGVGIDNDLKIENGNKVEMSEANKRDNILKLCEDFEALHNIFIVKKTIPILTHDTTTSYQLSHETDESSATSENVTNFLEVDCLEDEQCSTESPEPKTPQRQSTQISNSTTYLAEFEKDKTTYFKEKLDFLKATERKKLKLEEEEVALKREKLALDRERFKEETRLRELEIKSNFDLNLLRLEREMALKELELKYKYNKE